MDEAQNAGINFFDTANVYGRAVHLGATEEIIGKWFAQGGDRREKTVIATKVYGRIDEWPNNGRLSAWHIMRACEDSLRRLQTDHIDLYQMHHIDRNAPWDEVWQAMETLVAQGKVIYVGQQQLCRLAHCPGERGCKGASLPGVGFRAESLQPCCPHH
jgi:NDP-hexose 2,3-enoyl reductase